jgi:Na+-transporting NADH:ubiquinone oxidoreductase subunit C
VPSNKESLSRVLTVAFALCIVCSVVVSAAAVVLKPAQEINKTRDLKRNILMAAFPRSRGRGRYCQNYAAV